MRAKILFPVALLSLVGLIVLLIFLPIDHSTDGPETLPWAVSVDDQGRTHAFGLVLGVTTLGEASQRLRDSSNVSLYASKSGKMALEAYFQEVNLHGFRAKMVVTLEATPEELQAIYDRGARITTSSSGDKRVTLDDADLKAAQARPIHHIAYLPSTRLDPEIVERRFGKDGEKLRDTAGATHWLYPERGMDVAVDDDGKTVIQYSLPKEFEAIRAPLRAAAQASK